MANEIILHVGPHKTGSTALQHAFESRFAELDAAGVRYAVAGRADKAHHDLVYAVRGQPSSFDADALAAEAATVPRLLLSSENVVHLPERPMARLKASLPDGEVTIVYYLRRLLDLWPSHWQELVKHGSPLTFGEYLATASFTVAVRHNAHINQFQQLTVLQEVFGAERLHIVGYDRLRSTGADIYGHFTRYLLGLDIDEKGPATHTVNTTQPFWMTELLRLLNVIHLETTGQPARRLVRVAAIEAIEANRAPFLDELRALAEERAHDVVVRGNALFATHQRTIIAREFSACIVGDANAALDAYGDAADRRVPTFEFPRTGAEALFARIVEFYRSLELDADAPPPDATAPTGTGSDAARGDGRGG